MPKHLFLALALFLPIFATAQFTTQPTLWLDASNPNTLSTTTNTVESWSDQTSHDNHACQADSTKRPTLTYLDGLPAIEFTGTQYLDIPHDTTLCVNSSDGYQLFVVAQVFGDHATGDFRTGIIHKTTGVAGGNWGLRATNTSGKQVSGLTFNSSNAIIKGRAATGNWDYYDLSNKRALLGAWYDPATGIAKSDANGGLQYSNDYATTLSYNTVNVRLGNRNDPYPQTGAHMAIHEVLFFPTKLSATEKQEVENYLAQKWNIADYPYDFDPYQLADAPTLWLDAAKYNSLEMNGNEVMAWNDLSEKQHQATQANASNRPVYTQDNGLPMLEFNGTKYLDIPHDTSLCISSSDGYQVFAVAKIFSDHPSDDFRTGIIHKTPGSAGADWGIKASLSNGLPIAGLMYNSSGAIFRGEAADGADGFYDFGDQRSIFTTWYDAATGKGDGDANGGQQYMSEYSMTLNFAQADVRIGTRGAPYPRPVHLGIHELLFFPKKLNASDKAKVESYLSKKWNIGLDEHIYAQDEPLNGNIALGAAVSQSSDAQAGTTADKATDQLRAGILNCGTVSATNSEAQAWWEIDLGEIAEVTRLNIWNRTDGGETALSNYYVFASEQPFTSTDLNTTINQADVLAHLEFQQAARPTFIPINRTARYLRVQNVGTGVLSLAEVEVIGQLNDADRDGLTNAEELLVGTNPENNDSDNDGILDAVEVGDLNNPTDTDGDGYNDALDSATADSDQDGTADQADADNNNPCIPDNTVGICDQDSDGLSNAEEAANNSDPADACSPNPNTFGCATAAKAGGFYFAWDNHDPAEFGEKSISFDNTDLREIGLAPAIGQHPRVYFGPNDIPTIKNNMTNTTSGQAVMKQIHAYTTLLHKGYQSGGYNHNASYGRDAYGNKYIDNAGLWDSHIFYYNLINRLPDPLAGANDTRRGILAGVMAVEAYECMIYAGQTDPDTGLDYDQRALDLAKALAYWAETEQYNSTINLNNRFVMGGQHYALAYDINYNNMTPAQRDFARAGIAKMVSGKVLYGTDVVPEFTTSNWSTLNSFELIINLSIEGEKGYKPQVTKDFCKVFRNFLTYAWYESGAPFEGLGKNYQFNATMVPMAMRGYSVLGHPHVKPYGTDFLPAISQPYGFGFVGTDAWGGTGPNVEQGGYKFNQMDAIGIKYILPNDPNVDLVWKNYIGKSTRVSSEGYVYQEIEPRGYYNGLLVAAAYAEDYQAGDYNSQSEAVYTEDKLSYLAPIRGLVTMRSSGSTDAMMSHFHCRQNIGGHTYGDRNNFTLSSHDRIWIRYTYGNEIPETQGHSCILIDDLGLAQDGRNAQVPGKLTDFQEDGGDVQASGDATYAYSWDWDEDPIIPGQTSPVLLGTNGWEAVTESPADFLFQLQPETYYNIPHYDRPYWNGPENKITGRVKKAHLAVEKVYRTVAMARGEHPFLLVVDDVKMDENTHNYKWLAQIAQDLSIESTDINLDSSDYRCDVILKEATGSRKLLVRVLQNNGYTSGAPAYTDEFVNFRGNVCPRLVIEADVVSPDFKVLIYPYDTGEPLPQTIYDATENEWLVTTGNDTHIVTFTDDNGKTLVNIEQENRINLKTMLAGPYDQNTGLMNANLSTYLPEAQPYNTAPWNYAGAEMRDLNYSPASAEDEIVDWILVQLLDKNDPYTVVATQAALLQRDGDVVAADGVSPLSFRGTDAGDYFVAIRHRNHIAIRSSGLVSVGAAALDVDFTVTAAHGAGSQVSLGGVLALHAGDSNADGVVDAGDRSAAWNGRNGFGYLAADLNCDGVVDAGDRSLAWNGRNVGVAW